MKKVSASLLLLLFLITNSGMALSVHWCGGKLAAIAFYSFDEHPCKCKKKSMKPNCCKDKTTHLKASDELNKSNQLSFKIPIPKFEFDIQTQIVFPTETSLYLVSGFYHPPLFKPKVPIYLLEKVFLI